MSPEGRTSAGHLAAPDPPNLTSDAVVSIDALDTAADPTTRPASAVAAAASYPARAHSRTMRPARSPSTCVTCGLHDTQPVIARDNAAGRGAPRAPAKTSREDLLEGVGAA
jgi:hypothetical protein